MYDIHTGTRNFCKFSTPVAQYQGYGYALLKPGQQQQQQYNGRKGNSRYGYGYNIRIRTYPELNLSGKCCVWYVQNHTRGITRARDFCKFCTAFTPVPVTSVRAVPNGEEKRHDA